MTANIHRRGQRLDERMPSTSTQAARMRGNVEPMTPRRRVDMSILKLAAIFFLWCLFMRLAAQWVVQS